MDIFSSEPRQTETMRTTRMKQHSDTPTQSTATQIVTRLTSTTTYLTLLIALSLFTGCESGGRTSTPSPASSNSPLAQANADYQAGHYSSAYQSATNAYNEHHTNSQIHKQAGYLAGLSAYQLRKYDDAQKYLRPLRVDTNPNIAGNASATLGLIARENNRPAEAVILFKNAYRKLSDQDQAEAAYQAGLAYRKLGQTAQARQQFLLARAASHDSKFRSQVDQYIQDTGWTVQLGAFTSITNAQKRLAEYDTMPARRSLGSAHILQQSNTTAGTTLYLVRVGNFMDYNLAAQARSKITGPAVIKTIHPKS